MIKASVMKDKKLYLKNVMWVEVSAGCTWHVEVKCINIIKINKIICINQQR